MFSIVIPLYNKEKHILETLNCIMRQTIQDFEIIIIDDGSTDNGPSIIKRLNNPKIRLINQPNKGASAARNKGVQEANNKYIAFLDADDIWKDNYLERMQRLILKFPNAVAYGSNYEILEKGNIRVLDYPNLKNGSEIMDNYFISGKVFTPLWTSAVVVNRDVFLAVGGFPLNCKVCEDIDLWCRLALYGDIAYCNEPLARYIRDSTNMLSRSKSSCYFPFLDNYKELITINEKRKQDIIDFVTYKKIVAAWHALFVMNNGKYSRQIIESIGNKNNYSKKIKLYKIVSYFPNCFIKIITKIKMKNGDKQ